MENLYGLIGERLGHTFSPQIHNKIMEETHTSGHYGLFEVKKENLQFVVNGLKALGYKGVNVTIPYKLDIIKYLDFLSPEASKIGAVNVVSIDKNGASTGYNTDYYGFGMMLDHAGVKIENETAVVLGTGGASKAVTQYLKDSGIKELILVSRNAKSAKEKYPDDKIITYNELNKLYSCSMVINCTPIGMFPKTEQSPLDKELLNKFNTAVDLIYNPPNTLFLKEAKEKGLKAINGLYMLAAQAVKSQEIWNESKLEAKVIDNILDMF